MKKQFLRGFAIAYVSSLLLSIIFLFSAPKLMWPFTTCTALPSGILGGIFSIIASQTALRKDKSLKIVELWSSFAGFGATIVLLPYLFILMITFIPLLAMLLFMILGIGLE